MIEKFPEFVSFMGMCRFFCRNGFNLKRQLVVKGRIFVNVSVCANHML